MTHSTFDFRVMEMNRPIVHQRRVATTIGYSTSVMNSCPTLNRDGRNEFAIVVTRDVVRAGLLCVELERS